jgi:hypothetical protein
VKLEFGDFPLTRLAETRFVRFRLGCQKGHIQRPRQPETTTQPRPLDVTSKRPASALFRKLADAKLVIRGSITLDGGAGIYWVKSKYNSYQPTSGNSTGFP